MVMQCGQNNFYINVSYILICEDKFLIFSSPEHEVLMVSYCDQISVIIVLCVVS